MNNQQIFDFNIKEIKDLNSFYVNFSNSEAYNIVNDNSFNGNILLNGPKKSGKTHLGLIWAKLNNAILYKENFNEIVLSKNNIFIDDVFNNINEENVLHIVNHCKNENLKILITTDIDLFEYDFQLLDLESRLKTFHYTKIKNPDDEMSIIILTKLLSEKQFIIKNKDLFDFLIKRVNRSYESIYKLVNKMDKLSLEKKRQLTIPLIKEIL